MTKIVQKKRGRPFGSLGKKTTNKEETNTKSKALTLTKKDKKTVKVAK